MTHRNHIDQIDLYHTGQMTPDEQIAFEKQLEADPSLKAESDFQSEIINGLREYRKLQLKSRLDGVEITTGWLEFAQQSTLVKSFGGIVIASAIGTGVYYLAEKEETTNVNDLSGSIFVEALEMEVPTEQVQLFDWSLEEGAQDAIQSEKVQEIEASFKSKEESVQEILATEEVKQEEFVPSFEAPVVEEIEDTDIKTSELATVETLEAEETEEAPLDIETVNTRSNKIKYKYYDGKLFLTGNFGDTPYEIIEINGAEGRRIYLLHNRKYYQVNITDRLTELPEVRNIKLIQELRLIKQNK